jgi:hypothetical protein
VKKSPPVAGLQIAVASRRRNSSEYLPGIPALLALLGALRPARSGDFFTTSETITVDPVYDDAEARAVMTAARADYRRHFAGRNCSATRSETGEGLSAP